MMTSANMTDINELIDSINIALLPIRLYMMNFAIASDPHAIKPNEAKYKMASIDDDESVSYIKSVNDLIMTAIPDSKNRTANARHAFCSRLSICKRSACLSLNLHSKIIELNTFKAQSAANAELAAEFHMMADANDIVAKIKLIITDDRDTMTACL